MYQQPEVRTLKKNINKCFQTIIFVRLVVRTRTLVVNAVLRLRLLEC